MSASNQGGYVMSVVIKGSCDINNMVSELSAWRELLRKFPCIPHKVATIMAVKDRSDPHVYARVTSSLIHGTASLEDYNTGFKVHQLVNIPVDDLLHSMKAVDRA